MTQQTPKRNRLMTPYVIPAGSLRFWLHTALHVGLGNLEMNDQFWVGLGSVENDELSMHLSSPLIGRSPWLSNYGVEATF